MSDRRRLRSPSAAVPIFRVVSLLAMLAVMGLTIWKLKERASSDAAAPAAQRVAEPAKKKIEAAATAKKQRKPGPEEDAQQQEDFRRRSQAILDRSTSLHRYEMPAYWQVIDWVESQSLADFQGRSLPQIRFQNYLQHPGKYRGQPVRVALEIRQALSFDLDNPAKGSRPRKLYELWGVPTELDGWLYVIVTPELPAGFPLGKNLGVTTTAYGYFFKLQGYQPFDAKPDARPLLAPMIIGRITPVAVVATRVAWNPLGGIVLVVGGAILIAVIAGWVIAARRKPVSQTAASLDLPETLDIGTIDDNPTSTDTSAGVEHE